MTKNIYYLFMAGLTCLMLTLTGCGTTGSSITTTTSGTTAGNPPAVSPTAGPAPATSVIEAALPLIRTGAAVATGAVLDFGVQQSSTRTRLANEMYAAANAVYSLSGGKFPSPTQFESSIVTFGGSQTDASYAQFSTTIAALYAAYYPKLMTGDAKTASDLLNAIAGGIEDATQAYVTVPSATTSVGDFDGISGIGRTELAEFLGGKAGPDFQIFQTPQFWGPATATKLRGQGVPKHARVMQLGNAGAARL